MLNGAGELTGSLEVAEWGELATPVYLTATMSVGRVYDGAVAAAVAADPRMGVDDVVIPVVGECDDSWLNDARVVQVEAEDVSRALADAERRPRWPRGRWAPAPGWSASTGRAASAARAALTGEGHTVGVLVLANFGDSPELRVDGVPVGQHLRAGPGRRGPAGSCIAVVATDAPLALRPARRASRGEPVSASRAPDRSPTTAAARSSSPSRPPPRSAATTRGRPRSPTTRSTRSSRPPSRPPRRPS